MGDVQQEAFLKWLDAAGGLLHPQLDMFADTGATGRGVQAQARIAQGEQLAKIPLDCCLHLRHQVQLRDLNMHACMLSENFQSESLLESLSDSVT